MSSSTFVATPWLVFCNQSSVARERLLALRCTACFEEGVFLWFGGGSEILDTMAETLPQNASVGPGWLFPPRWRLRRVIFAVFFDLILVFSYTIESFSGLLRMFHNWTEMFLVFGVRQVQVRFEALTKRSWLDGVQDALNSQLMVVMVVLRYPSQSVTWKNSRIQRK